MLTNERQEIIMKLLAEKQTIKIQDIVEATMASESTIRRDLTELEEQHKLERIHGGATVSERKLQEMSITEKSSRNLQEKVRIAKYAASLVQDGDCIFIDAGTTTFQMIPFLGNKNIVVVTNGLTHVNSLIEQGITTYLTGGYVKAKTSALVGPQTIQSLENYRFDKCFLGVNGFHIEFGFTTPDPEEAAVKQLARTLAKKTYVVADHSKYDKVSFAKIDDMKNAVLLTGPLEKDTFEALEKMTTVEVI
ncbi:DeoR/GlpR family DNA-binding transcription regulator [Sporosarcina sp. G11-34]|uniref:DeoR/GlpR family DNA-binding transcription regulator n=1 Tax=Sporosarcina sp. G11-34 TaxID=2849605 RepID=UPI0022A8EAFA|nr:DeoR/GlpR family DNA-binding transcription regulator [Sporosarcina sp. G11-34]MCZ2260537.1 DeoR/GlpR family DNA-binding transcription regulator [Sporosarcina sp. G11-34]